MTALSEFIDAAVSVYRDDPDDHVLSLGDWLESNEGRQFDASLRVTVGDFRRWQRLLTNLTKTALETQ